ncbi:two-component response regulator [Cyanobium sp. PCC 7001]|uniref:response regulator transcription factor n=1 Tax=Cyanobium sp. PCC 7001 TaxID=180281 RepID=UPI00018049D0|nr:response regulator transcription factor [Cyanobium sp. PCC 7001]EDY39206.1 two-component response regulator [Cyanobium sp. PCC 7001]
MSGPRLLIVDDDPELRRFLRTELELEGYSCEEASTGQQALQRVRAGGWELLLLDWSLPDFSGVEICRRLRSTGDTTQVLMVTARDDVQERVAALDAGADDYLTKPFSIEELLARVRARLRRRGAEQTQEPALQVLSLADLEMVPARHEVSRAGAVVTLTNTEYELLKLLLEHPKQVQRRADILKAVWGETWVGDDNVLDVYIRSLRRKLEPPGSTTLIQTVRGVGFMLREGEPRS